MKKVLLTMFMAVTTLVAMAQTTNYTDNLVVTINEISNEPQKTDIAVEQNNDGTYTLSLNKFTLISGEDIMPVGNIVLENIEATEENGIKSFAVERNIIITAGDENESDWLGPMLGEVPVSLTGKMDAEKLFCTIDIDMSELLGQVINVVFGDDNFSNNANSVKYTDNLVVTINGTSNEPQKTDITVEQNNDGTYTLSLNKFTLISGEDIMPVGNIVLENIVVTEENGIKSFAVERNIIITAGDENEGDWLGPMLGDVPVSLTGKMDAEKLFCTIDIDMSELLGQTINVVFGDEDSVTSIENIAAENGVKRIFDITGREIKEITVPGIYIVNGKKIFVK
ncbi:MAG: calycin-like domain-containing protein [Bacteroidaceae bacterium]|nr:calycin-like domain-containing protein [Bacteroidaceae bacterium]